jgi:hypothetical protein
VIVEIVPVIFPPKQTALALVIFFYRARFRAKKSALGLESITVSRVSGLCSSNLLTESNIFDLGYFLLFYSISEPQKPSSLELKNGTRFWGSGLRRCNLLFERNNFRLGVFPNLIVRNRRLVPFTLGLLVKTTFKFVVTHRGKLA